MKNIKPKLSKEFLEEQVITLNKGFNDIAIEFGYHQKTIQKACKRFNILSKPKRNELILSEDFFKREYIEKQKSFEQIGKENNINWKFVAKTFKRYGLSKHRSYSQYRVKDLSGLKIGKLNIISFFRKTDKRGESQVYWKCKCDCGTEKTIAAKYFNDGRVVKSCGCLIPLINSNKNWRGYEDITGNYFCSLKRNAKIRKIDFNITLEDIWNQYVKQDKRCALTKLPIVFMGKMNYNKEQTASVDRIDSTKGYFINNIQIIHKAINFMKSDLPEEKFIEYCQMVSGNFNLKFQG